MNMFTVLKKLSRDVAIVTSLSAHLILKRHRHDQNHLPGILGDFRAVDTERFGQIGINRVFDLIGQQIRDVPRTLHVRRLLPKAVHELLLRPVREKTRRGHLIVIRVGNGRSRRRILIILRW